MKKTILFISLLFAATFCRATNFVFVPATTDTAVAHWLLAIAQADSDLAYIAELGARPTPPLYDSTGAQWATFTAAAYTYDSALAVYTSAWNTDIVTQATDEIVVLTSLGYQTGKTNIVANQWVKVSGNNFSTQWIGYVPDKVGALCNICTLSPHILTSLTQPVNAFPKK